MKKKDIFSRFMSATTDLVITLLPILVWDLIVLIVLAGFLPSKVMTFLDEVILYVIVVSFCVTNPLITLIYGKTFGQTVFDIKIIDLKGKSAKGVQQALREFIGGIVILGCSFIFYGAAIPVYLLLNLIVMLLDKYDRGIPDFICHTRPVVWRVQETKVVEKKKEEPREEPFNVPFKNESFYHYDLHVHSKHSLNGMDSVEEIFQKAKKLGVEVVSITDLYSVKANYEAEVLSKPYGISYISGIEMECEYEGYPCTILGYGINYKDPVYVQLENEYIKTQREASLNRIEKFKEASGIELNTHKLINLNSNGIVTGEMIVQEVLENPLFENLHFLKPYQEEKGAGYRHLYMDLFAPGKPCYIKKSVLKLEDVLDLIHKTGGKAVLAYPKRVCGDDVELLERMMDQGIDGLEVFSSYHEEQDVKRYLEVVRHKNCYVSCGSDTYGDNGLMIQIGDSKASMKYEKLIRILIDHLKRVEQ